MKILILFGSMTGNAEDCAHQLGARLESDGHDVSVEDMADVTPDRLKEEKTVFVSISTWGDGDPPDCIEGIWEGVVEEANFDLSHIQYSVLALGDTAYEKFCEAGKAIDAAFEKQGAKRIIDRVDCDVYYDDDVEKWINSVSGTLEANAPAMN